MYMIPFEVTFLSIYYSGIHFYLTPTIEVNKCMNIWRKWPLNLIVDGTIATGDIALLVTETTFLIFKAFGKIKML